ncbi:MAG: hypothetical protein NC930_05845 [Candidatus Omnitrophica bacterium]|nr:hypothetical protein [Candidatus Omnitrophota bacterium]
MTYEELVDLKFHKGLSTCALVRLFPDEIERVSEVALLEVPDATLKAIIPEPRKLNRLMRLKKRFLGKGQE